MDKILLPLTLLPIAGGFIFASLWEPIRYEMMRSEGQRLYLQSIYYGGILAIFIFFIICSADRKILEICESGENCLQLYVVWSFLSSLLLAYPLVYFANLYVDEYKYWFKSLDDIERVLLDAFNHKKPIMITLKSNKVYVGYVERIEDPSDRKSKDWIELQMLLSGYRDEKSLVHYTVNYANVIDGLIEDLKKNMPNQDTEKSVDPEDLKEFTVYVPVNEVISIHRYNPIVHNKAKQSQPKAQTEKPPDQHRQ